MNAVSLVDLHRGEAQIERLARRHLDRIGDNAAVLPKEEVNLYFAMEAEALTRAADHVRRRAVRLARETAIEGGHESRPGQ